MFRFWLTLDDAAPSLPLMTRGEILILNERVKGISQMVFNLAAALVAAIVARFYALGSADFVAILWCLGVAVLVFVAWKVLYMLESEH